MNDKFLFGVSELGIRPHSSSLSSHECSFYPRLISPLEMTKAIITVFFLLISILSSAYFVSASVPNSDSDAEAEVAAAVKFVRKTIASHSIAIFSKSYCPYCRKAKSVFKELNQVPHVVELDQREDGHLIQDALREIVGRRTVPQVFIDGKHLGGSDDTVDAYENGKLAKLLGVSTGQKDDL